MSDAELAAEIEANEANPNSNRPQRGRQPKAKVEKIEFKGDGERKVWVRVVTDLEPWADDKKLAFWGTYEITLKDAALLESRKFAVILETPT